MKTKSSFLAFLLVLVSFMAVQPLFAQENKTSVSHPSYLESVNDLCMVGDQLWLATNGGLVRFNTLTGTFACYNKSNAGLPINQVNLISPYADGQIAYSTAKGIGIFRDTNTVSFLTHTDINEGPNSKYRTRMEFFNGKLHLCILNRILIYNQNTWASLNVLPLYMSSLDLVYDLEQGPNGNVYAATMRGIREIMGDTVLNDVVKGRSFTNLAFISNEIWMASANGLFCFKDTLRQVLNATVLKQSTSDSVLISMKKSVDGKLWLLTRKGLTLFDPTTSLMMTYRIDSLKIAAKPLMTVDAIGNVWLVGQKPGKIWKFDGAAWSQFCLQKGLASNYVSAFVPSGNHLWIGCKDSTFFNYDGNGSCVLDSAAISLLKQKRPIYIKGKRLVFFADSSIVVDRYDSIRALIKVGSVNKMTKAAYDAASATYWAATKAGVEQIKDSILSVISVKALGAASDKIFGLYLEKTGALLVSTYPDPKSVKGGQLMRYQSGSLEILYSCSNPSLYISSVVRDSAGVLWMGIMDVKKRGKWNGGGVVCIKGKNISVYTASNSGLPSNSVSDISIDRNGSIWFACFDGGLTRLTKTGTWTNYTSENSALESDSLEQVAVDDDNNIWASTLNGGLTFLAGDPIVNKLVTAIKPATIESKNAFEVYSMPFSTDVNLKFSASVVNARVTVFDVSGQKRLDGLFTVPQGGVLTLSVNSLSKGLYIVKVSSTGSSECRKFIVQ